LAYTLSSGVDAYWPTVARLLAESSLAGTTQSTAKVESCPISPIVTLESSGHWKHGTSADRLCNYAIWLSGTGAVVPLHLY